MRLAKRAHRTRTLFCATQLHKFESLYNLVFAGHVPATLAARYQAALNEFRSYGE